MKLVIILLGLALFIIAGPVTPASDYEIVDCCIKPCSCLGPKAGKPTCKKMPKAECLREGGEVVPDCMLCD